MPITIYKCAKCKMARGSYEEAERCEEGHLPAVSVRELEYKFGAYPARVALTFPDGAEREYVADYGFHYGSEVRRENDKDKGNGKNHKGAR